MKSFFMMDENFLLYKQRAMELLELMKAHGKAWSLYVFSSANAIAKYTMRELVELGVELGLARARVAAERLREAERHRHAGADDGAAVARHPRARARPSSASSTTRPRTSTREIEHAVAHDTDFHQFMLYTPVPGTPLYEEMAARGAPADGRGPGRHPRPGQVQLPARGDLARRSRRRCSTGRSGSTTSATARASTASRRTMLEGWQRYRNDPDPRVRERVARRRRSCAAATARRCGRWRSTCAESNVEVSRNDPRLAQGHGARTGPLPALGQPRSPAPRCCGWPAATRASTLTGSRIEPMTFFERRNWPETA